jgi:uncharacterized protein
MWRLRFDYWRGVPVEQLAARYQTAPRARMTMNATHILLFAKAPVAGRVKTRLIPALGAAGAAELARRMLEHALRSAIAADIGSLELCASPPLVASGLAGIPLPAGIANSDQGEGDLGARMARAAHRALASHARVLLIGADCPALTAQHLRDAAAALTSHDAVHAAGPGWRLSAARLTRFAASCLRPCRGVPRGSPN